MKPKFLMLFVLLVSPMFSYQQESRIYKDAVSLSMGGVGVSTIGYQFSAMRNPANLGLMADYDLVSFASLGVNTNPYMVDFIDKLTPILEGEISYDAIDYDSLIGSAPSVSLNGPINLGYMGKGFGFWTTSSSDATLALSANNDPDNLFNKYGVDVSLNEMVKIVSTIESSLENGKISEEEVKELLNLKFSTTLTEEQILDIAQELDSLDDATDLLKGLLPLAYFSLTAEIAVNMGYGHRFAFEGIDDVSGLSFGATVRFAQRFKATTGNDMKPIDELATSYGGLEQTVFQASSISSDFGVSLRLQNLIIGAAVRDAFSTEFEWKSMNGEGVSSNTKLPMSVDFGASYRFYFNNIFIQEIGMYVEFEDVMDEYSSWNNKLRIGSEFKLFNFLDARVGMYNQHISGGIGMGWKWFRIDATYYREKYLDYFTSDQYYVNMTFGLDNSPRRKNQTVQRQLEHDRIQTQNIAFIDGSLEGI